MSVNQMAVYHNIMEIYNIVHNSSSDQIQNKDTHQDTQKKCKQLLKGSRKAYENVRITPFFA